MNALGDLGSQGLLIVVGCSVLFGAIAGYAIAAGSRFSIVAGTVIGALLWIPGLIGLGIYAIVRRSRSEVVSDSVAVASTESSSGFDISPDPEGYAGFSSFDAPGVPGARAGSAAASVAGAGFGSFDGAGFGSFDDSALVDDFSSRQQPVAAVVSTASGARRFDWVRTPPGAVAVGLLVIVALLLAYTLTVPWFGINSSVTPKLRVYAPGTGLDVIVLVSVVLAGLCAIATVVRPSRVVAVIIAWLSGSMLLASLLVFSAGRAVASALAEAGDYEMSISQGMSILGVDTGDLDGSLDLQSLGLSAADIGAVDIMAALPQLEVTLGTSWMVVLACGIIGHVAVFVLLFSASRRDRLSRIPADS